MAEHSYLDIHPTHRIADKIEREDPDFKFLNLLIVEVNAYVEIMEQENIAFLKSHIGHDLSSRDTYKFLRSQERTRNYRWILQYLAAFTSHLPIEPEIGTEPANPFDQLKYFTIYSIDLLKEKDVSTAILKEHEKLGLLNETNSWYYRGQIEKSHRSLMDMVNRAQRATLEDYKLLFQGIQQLCNFWFSVRNQEIKRTRKSDLLIYKLTRYLLHIY